MHMPSIRLAWHDVNAAFMIHAAQPSSLLSHVCHCLMCECGEQVVKIRVAPGPDGEEAFKRKLCELCGVSPDADLSKINFEFRSPVGDGEWYRLRTLVQFSHSMFNINTLWGKCLCNEVCMALQ